MSLGRDGCEVVSVLAFYSESSSSNPDEFQMGLFLITFVFPT